MEEGIIEEGILEEGIIEEGIKKKESRRWNHRRGNQDFNVQMRRCNPYVGELPIEGGALLSIKDVWIFQQQFSLLNKYCIYILLPCFFFKFVLISENVMILNQTSAC